MSHDGAVVLCDDYPTCSRSSAVNQKCGPPICLDLDLIVNEKKHSFIVLSNFIYQHLLKSEKLNQLGFFGWVFSLESKTFTAYYILPALVYFQIFRNFSS